MCVMGGNYLEVVEEGGKEGCVRCYLFPDGLLRSRKA